MKTIVILSDTHGNIQAIQKLLPIMNESDYVFHLGDYQSDIMPYIKDIKADVHTVKGNCDFGNNEEIVQVEDVKILITHGNKYRVKSTMYPLLLRAKELGVNAVFYGHTHVSDITVTDGITFINPGCMTRFSDNSYCYAVVNKEKIITKIVKIN